MGTARKARLAEVENADFEPANIDLEQIFTNNQVLNPGMVAFRIAAVALNKTQDELTTAVRALEQSDALEEMIEMLLDADEMFEVIHTTCAEAERRISVCMTKREKAHDGDGRL